MTIALTALEIAERSFVVVQAGWPVERGHQLVSRLRPGHVIVQRTDGSERHHYLFIRSDFLTAAARRSGAPSIGVAVELDRHLPVPLVAADVDGLTAPDRCIVHEDGYPVGVLDASVPPGPTGTRGGIANDARLAIDDASRPGPASVGAPTIADRALVTEFPERITLGRPTSLLVYLSASEDAGGSALPVPLAIGAQVHVIVQPQGGVEVRGDTEGTLVVSDTDRTLALRFQIVGTASGPAQLEVLAFHGVQPIGALKVRSTVVADSGDQSPSGRERRLAPVAVRQPELTLLILERSTNGGRRSFDLLLTAADPALKLSYKRFGPVTLQADPAEYFESFFRGIEDLPVTTGDERRAAERRLAAKGTQLFRTLFDPELQTLLWSLRGRIRSVQIQSEEPWIPWELCRLCGEEGGRTVEGPFLGEAFAVTRSLRGIASTSTLTVRNMAIVVPEDSGLAYAATELRYLRSLARDGRRVDRIPATFLAVTDALASGRYDAWHFTGHGSFGADDPNRSAVYLRDNDPLTPEDLSGEVANLGQASPLVFLNACQVGRAAMSLTDIGGWASQFLRAGAGAFVGSYWSVYDLPAHGFATEFYDRLLAGTPIGSAAQEARTTIKGMGDPTWLAYTVFADPMATVVTDQPAPQAGGG
jgi:hypothetical protein